MVRLARVEALLSAAIEDVDEGALGRLVSGSVREDTDLEFKSQLYGNGDSERRELAGDVAAFANLAGGLMVIGIDESDGAAAALAPVPLSEPEDLRMRQILASFIAPHLPVRLRPVPSAEDPTKGYYLLAVDRSPIAPHAVRVGTALRYPRRYGASVRWLAETEVADSYRNRFELAAGHVARVNAVRQEVVGPLPDEPVGAWLTVGVVPELLGSVDLTRSWLRDLQTFPRDVALGILRLRSMRALEHAPSRPVAGHRRAVLQFGARSTHEGAPLIVHLHDDGSTGVSVEVGWARAEPGEEIQHVNVDDELLSQEVMFVLAMAARHTIRHARTVGAASVQAQIVGNRPLKLSYARGNFGGGHWAEEVASRDTALSQHAVDLEAIDTSPIEHLIATRTVVTDLLQSLGLVESPQITADGAIRHRYWSTGDEVIRAACEGLGVEVVSGTLDDP